MFINTLVQIAFLAANPIWSTIIIAMDVFVLYALTARWDEAKLALKSERRPDQPVPASRPVKAGGQQPRGQLAQGRGVDELAR